MRPTRTRFDFWDKRRGICPPLSDMQIAVRRSGRTEFRFFAPRAELPGTAEDITLGVVIGDRCSIGTLPATSLRQKGRALVYP
jgi:hypothetical protein